jgi:DNA repair exonuclease SbcCD ATPase subunit
LEGEVQTLQEAVMRLTANLSTLKTTANSEEDRAARADGAAEGFAGEAAQIAGLLGPAWADVLASDSAYDAECTSVRGSREMAERAGELGQVNVAQAEIDAADQRLKEQAGRLDPAHEQPSIDAEAAHVQAQDDEREHNKRSGAAKDRLTQLEERRETYVRLSETIDKGAEEETTYRILAELLRDGGPIQVALAGQEQRRIVEDVNGVLEQLGDSLRTQLGTARRATDAGIEDIHVVETLDPSGTPRYFEYLSGGEKFRIALALALALHRRVGKQAGTLIVDEGFGELDSRRRYDLAMRLTDTTDAILERQMARSIIICSHSEEVQQQFPNRWHVRKQGNAATAMRVNADDRTSDGTDFA